MKHTHQWGPVELSRFAGTVHRKCQVSDCRDVTLDVEDPVFRSDFTPSAGYTTIEEEHEARLRKAVTNPRNDCIVLYSKRQDFQMEGIRFANGKGWVDDGTLVELDSQSTQFEFRLTAAGKKHFWSKA